MKNKRNITHMIDVLFTLGLLCVFAASALAVVLIGAHVYKATTSHMDANYTTRTSLSYVAEKIRRYDESGSVAIGSIEDAAALILPESIDGREYVTYIYADNGTLRELFTEKDKEVKKSQGEAILEVQDFTIETATGGFFRFTAADKEERSVSLLIHTRSES